MRLLLDENLPKRLKLDFAEHEIYTVRDKGWNGIKNGDLIKLVIENLFDALITFDKNLQHQQNLSKNKITILVLTAKSNSYKELTKLSGKVKNYLDAEKLSSGVVIIKAD